MLLLHPIGRARLFHGVNIVSLLNVVYHCPRYFQVYKSFPYYPNNVSFDPEYSLSNEDIQFLKDNGFNVVRLYVAWPGVEPKKDQYNDTYLDVSNSFNNFNVVN